MRCHRVYKNLNGYIDDELPPFLRTAVSAHLKGCPECRKRWRRLAETHGKLAALEETIPSEETGARILRTVQGRVFPRGEENSTGVRNRLLPVLEGWQAKFAYPFAGVAVAIGLTVGTIMGLQVKDRNLEQVHNIAVEEDNLLDYYPFDYLAEIPEDSLAGAYLAATGE